MLFESCTKIKTEFFSGIGGMTRIRKDVAILARGQGSRKVEEVTYGCLLIYIYYIMENAVRVIQYVHIE